MNEVLWDNTVQAYLRASVFFVLFWLILFLIKKVILARLRKHAERTSWVLNGFLWIIALLFVLANLGVNITSAVAGLGIGGIAIALATQGLLGDLFSSLMILLDRPFRVGDRISTGDVTGTVEYIGIKPRRLRSITGEEVIMERFEKEGISFAYPTQTVYVEQEQEK